MATQFCCHVIITFADFSASPGPQRTVHCPDLRWPQWGRAHAPGWRGWAANCGWRTQLQLWSEHTVRWQLNPALIQSAKKHERHKFILHMIILSLYSGKCSLRQIHVSTEASWKCQDIKRYVGFFSVNHSVVVTPLTDDASVANFVVKTTDCTVIVTKTTNLLGKAIWQGSEVSQNN